MSNRRRRAILALAALCNALACTQDFERFDPASGSGAASSTASSGGPSGGAGDGGAGDGGLGASGGAGGAGATGAEDCLDALDNDGDALIDCADDDCQPGFECVGAAPSRWQAYVRVRSVAYPSTPVPCPDGAAPATYFSGPTSATCSACTCGGWIGGTCGVPPATLWEGSASCQGGTASDLGAVVSGAACHDPPLSGTIPRSIALLGPAPLVDPGACPAAGGEVIVAPPWTSQEDVCSVAGPFGAGCGDGSLCVPRGTGEYDGPACITQGIDTACPAGWSDETQTYQGGIDERDCSACGCSVTGASCIGGSIAAYDHDGCKGQSVSIASTACVDVTTKLDGASGSVRATVPPATGGSCVPTGGEPIGTVKPTGPLTICCPR
jgi:hypothetical protein